MYKLQSDEHWVVRGKAVDASPLGKSVPESHIADMVSRPTLCMSHWTLCPVNTHYPTENNAADT